MTDKKEDVLIEHHIAAIQHGQPFWSEIYTETLRNAYLRLHKTEVIRKYYIIDIVITGDKTLIKFAKRLFPLTDEQLKNDYGREDTTT